jgi:hypothetical protein
MISRSALRARPASIAAANRRQSERSPASRAGAGKNEVKESDCIVMMIFLLSS